MYQIKKSVSFRLYDLLVNNILVLRGSKKEVNEFVTSYVKPLGLSIK